MAMGRPRKPTAIKELQGNPGKRPLNKNEPKPKRILPPPPSMLGKIAKREYKRVGQLLLDLGVMTEADYTALVLYANQYELFVQATHHIELLGILTEGSTGQIRRNPAIDIQNSAIGNMVRILTEFGMTPASRSKIVAAPVEEASIAEMLMNAVILDE